MPLLHVLLARATPGQDAGVSRVLDELARFATSLPSPARALAGPDVSNEGFQQGFTHGLVVAFDDPAGRYAYLRHPQHEELARALTAVAECLVVAVPGDLLGTGGEGPR